MLLGCRPQCLVKSFIGFTYHHLGNHRVHPWRVHNEERLCFHSGALEQLEDRLRVYRGLDSRGYKDKVMAPSTKVYTCMPTVRHICLLCKAIVAHANLEVVTRDRDLLSTVTKC